MAQQNNGASCQLCGEPIAQAHEAVRLPRMADYPAWLSFLADRTVHRDCLHRTPFRSDLLKVWTAWWDAASREAEVRFQDEERLLFVHRTGTGFSYVYHPRFLVLQGEADALPDLRVLFRDRAGRAEFPFGRCEVAPDPVGLLLTVTQASAGPVLYERFTAAEWEAFVLPFHQI